jgi:hypothetical protein
MTAAGLELLRRAGKPAEIAVDQIRVPIRSRVTRTITQLSAPEPEALRELIRHMYGDP